VHFSSVGFVHRISIYYTLDFNFWTEIIMRLNLIFTFVTGIALATAGCGGGATTPTGGANTNVANVNGNANVADSAPIGNSGIETTKKPEAATVNNAPTIAPVVQAYYDALKKKDDAMLKSVMSQEFITSIEADMKAEKKTNMAAYLAEFESIPDKPVEVRNEKIEGNDAVAELKGGSYLTWTPFAFANEGGKWKFTGGSPVLK
jgi:hypothetical protein